MLSWDFMMFIMFFMLVDFRGEVWGETPTSELGSSSSRWPTGARIIVWNSPSTMLGFVWNLVEVNHVRMRWEWVLLMVIYCILMVIQWWYEWLFNVFFMVVSIVIDGKNEMISPHFSSTVSINGFHQSSWLIRGIIPKWPYFRLVNYYNLPRRMKWN